MANFTLTNFNVKEKIWKFNRNNSKYRSTSLKIYNKTPIKFVRKLVKFTRKKTINIHKQSFQLKKQNKTWNLLLC